MSAKNHYDNLLADVYSWMTGDFIRNSGFPYRSFEASFKKNGITIISDEVIRGMNYLVGERS